MKHLKLIAAIIVVVALLLGGWRLHRWWNKPNPRHAKSMSPPAQLVPFRTPGGMLHTNGFTKTESLRQQTSSWLGTTTSTIRLNATYRYEIELRERWNLLIDDTRKVAFVVAPAFRAQLPVAVDSRTVEESTISGWGRFDKWEHLQAYGKKLRRISAGKPPALDTWKWPEVRPGRPSKSSSRTGCSGTGAGRSIPNAS